MSSPERERGAGGGAGGGGGNDEDDDRSDAGGQDEVVEVVDRGAPLPPPAQSRIERLLLGSSSSDSDAETVAFYSAGGESAAVASSASLPDDDNLPPRSDHEGGGAPTWTPPPPPPTTMINDEGRPVSYSDVDPRRVYCGRPLPLPAAASASSFASVAAAAAHPRRAAGGGGGGGGGSDLAAAIAAAHEAGLVGPGGAGGGAGANDGGGVGGPVARCGPEVGPQCPSCARYQNRLRIGTLGGRFPSLVVVAPPSRRPASSSSSDERREDAEEEEEGGDEVFVTALRASGGSLALATSRLSRLRSVDPVPTERQVTYLTNRLLRKFSHRFALPRKVVEIALRKSKCDATGAVSYLFGDAAARGGGGAAGGAGGGGSGPRPRVVRTARGAVTTTTEAGETVAAATGGAAAAATTNDQAARAEECFRLAVEEAVNERLRSMGLGVGRGGDETGKEKGAATDREKDDKAAKATDRGQEGENRGRSSEGRKASGGGATTAEGADAAAADAAAADALEPSRREEEIHETTKRSAHPFSPLLATVADGDDGGGGGGGPPPKVVVTKGHRMVLVEESAPPPPASSSSADGGARRKVARCALCCGRVPSVVSGRYKCSLCDLCEGCVQSNVDIEDRPRGEAEEEGTRAAPGGAEQTPAAAPKKKSSATATARGAEDGGGLPRRRSVVLSCPSLLNGGHLHHHPLTFTLERARRCVCDVEGPNCTIWTKSTKNECSWRCASGCDFDVCGDCVGMDVPPGFRRGDARGAAGSSRGGGGGGAAGGVDAAARARAREVEALLNDLNPVATIDGGGGGPIALTVTVNGTRVTPTATGMRRVAAAAGRLAAAAAAREDRGAGDPRSPRPPPPPPLKVRVGRGPPAVDRKRPPPPPGSEETPTASSSRSAAAAVSSSSSGGGGGDDAPDPKRRKIAWRMEEVRRRAAAAVAKAAAMRAGGTAASAPSPPGGGAGRPGGASGEEERLGEEGTTAAATSTTRAMLDRALRATRDAQAALRRLGGGGDGAAAAARRSSVVGGEGPADVRSAGGAGGAGGGGGGGGSRDGGGGPSEAAFARDAAQRLARADVAMAWNGPPTSVGGGALGAAVAPMARGTTLVGAGTVGGGGGGGGGGTGLPGDVALPAAFLRNVGAGQNGDVRAEYLMRRARRDYEMWRAQNRLQHPQQQQQRQAQAQAQAHNRAVAARRGRAPAAAAGGNGSGKGKFMMLSRETEEALRQLRERSCYAARSTSLGNDLETTKAFATAAAPKRAPAAAANPKEAHKENKNPKKAFGAKAPQPLAATATDLIYAESLLRSAQGVAAGGGGGQQQHAVQSFRKKVYSAVCAAVAAGRLGDAGTMLVSSRYGPAFLARSRDAAAAPPAPPAAAATSAEESAKRERDETPPSAAAKGDDDDDDDHHRDDDDDESAKCWCGERLDPDTAPAGAVGCLRDHPMHPSCACDLLLGGSMSCPTCRDLLYLPSLSAEETEFAVDFVRQEVRRLEREIGESNRPKEDSKAGAAATAPLGAGDVVAISADVDLCARIQGSDPLSGGWHPDMDAATGMEGRVLNIVEHDGRAVSARVKSISPPGHMLRAVGAKYRCVLGRLCSRYPGPPPGGGTLSAPTDGPSLACAHCRLCEACVAQPPGGPRNRKPCPGSVHEWSWDPRLLTLLRRSDQSTAEDEAKYDPKGMKAAMKAIERHVLQLRAELGAAKAGRDAVKAKISTPFGAFKDRLDAAGGDIADGPRLGLSEGSMKVLREVVPKVSIPDALFACHLLGLAEKWGDSKSARTKRDSVLTDVRGLNLSSAARSIRRRNASRAVDDALWRDDLAGASEYVVEPWASVDLLAAPRTGSSRTGFSLGPGTRFQTSDERLLPSEEGGLSLWLRVGEDAKDSCSSGGSTPAPPSVGTRVRRGKGWTYGDQDGGEGNEGVVVSRRSDRVLVMWDGKRGAHHYRAAELEVSYSPPLPQGWIRVRPLGEKSPAVVRRARKSIRCACCGDGLLPPPPQGEGGGSFSSVKGDAVTKGDRLVVAATLESVVVESVRDGRIYCSFPATEGNSECVDLNVEKPKENGGAIDVHGTAGKVLAAAVASVPCRDDNRSTGPPRKRTRLGVDSNTEGGARVHGGCKIKETLIAAAQDSSCCKSGSDKQSNADGKNNLNSKQSQRAGQQGKEVIWYRPEDLVLPRAAKTATQVIDHLDAKRLVEGRTVTRRELFLMTGRNENETRKRWIEAAPSSNQMELESDGGCGRQSQNTDDDDVDIKCFATCLKGHLLHPRCLQRSMLSGRSCPVPGCAEPLWVPPVQETPNGDGDAADCCGSNRAGAIEAEALRSASDLSNDALALAEEERSPGRATPDERLPAASLSGQTRLKMCPSCCAGPFVNDHCDSMRTHHGQCTAMALRRGVVTANGARAASTKACTPSGMFWASEADIVQSLAKLSGNKSVADVLPRCPTHDVVVMFNGCNTCGHLFTDTNWRDMPAWDPGAKAKLALDKKKMHAATLLATQVRKEVALLKFERNALSALALQEKAKKSEK